jgi:hypothetical protein
MTRKAAILSLVCVVGGMMIGVGCRKQGLPSANSDSPGSPKSKDTAQTTDPGKTPMAQPSGSAGACDEVLRHWQQGDREQAMSSLLQIDWTAQGLFSEQAFVCRYTALSSPKSVVSLSGDEKAKLGQELVDWVKVLGAFYDYVYDSAKTAASANDVEKAELCLKALGKYGEALSQSDKAVAIRFNGYNTQIKALQGLVEIYKPRGNTERLAATEKRLMEVEKAKKGLLK